MKAAVTGLLVLSIAATLTACSADNAYAPTPSTAPTPATAAPSPATTIQTPAPTLHDDDVDGLIPPAAEQLTAADSDAARARATAVMQAFSNTDQTAEDWLNGLLPHLTERAASEYEYTDPARVPVHTVGAARLLSGVALVTVVQVDTDAGAYTVSMTRPASDQLWLVSRITPPETTR